MASIWEKAISILAGNLDSGRSYLITVLKEFLDVCKQANIYCEPEEKLNTKQNKRIKIKVKFKIQFDFQTQKCRAFTIECE